MTLSGIQERFGATYIVPRAIARTDYYSFSLGYEDMHSDIDTHQSGLVSAGLDRARGRWRQRHHAVVSADDFDSRRTARAGGVGQDPPGSGVR